MSQSGGGLTSTGGVPTLGGTNAQGGAPAEGGTNAQGGMPGEGGTNTQGGTSALGGMPSEGGTNAEGGEPSEGGTNTQGGTSALGGMPSEGGTNAEGGEPSEGGTTTEGGAPGAGGASEEGGAASLGGAEGEGGSAGQGTIEDPVELSLSELCAEPGEENAWGVIERNLSNGEQEKWDGGPITIDGVVYSRGLGMHAPAQVSYALGGHCTRLTTTVGIDDEMKSAGSVSFEVYGDDRLLVATDVLTGESAGVPLDVDVTGVSELRLVANDSGGNGSDHADFAIPVLTCAPDILPLCPDTGAPVTVPDGYTLVWSDEFDTEGVPNPENWSFETGFVRNEEAQWYQADNAHTQAGFLIIEGRRERVENPNYEAGSSSWKTNRQYAEYTSSSLHSRGQQSWQYGRFELRARIVASAGLWPAWWTLGVNGEWPANGEIDILEYYGGNLHANVACGTETRWTARWDSVTRAVSSLGADWDAKFHLYAMDWDDTNIVLSVDGEVLNTTVIDDMRNPDGSSPFRQPHYMLINLALGGSAGGELSGTAFPNRYEVDWVRVFQRS